MSLLQITWTQNNNDQKHVRKESVRKEMIRNVKKTRKTIENSSLDHHTARCPNGRATRESDRSLLTSIIMRENQTRKENESAPNLSLSQT